MQITNIRVGYLVHAYRQAPWRLQRQWLGGFLLAVLGIAMVASLYLDVTAQAAISGREIQNLASDIIAVQHNNADLETRLAELTSNTNMEQRAQALGYEAVDPSAVEYIVVPGYTQPQLDVLSVAPSLRPSAPSVPPEFTESLVEWLQNSLQVRPTLGVTGNSQ